MGTHIKCILFLFIIYLFCLILLVVFGTHNPHFIISIYLRFFFETFFLFHWWYCLEHFHFNHFTKKYCNSGCGMCQNCWVSSNFFPAMFRRGLQHPLWCCLARSQMLAPLPPPLHLLLELWEAIGLRFLIHSLGPQPQLQAQWMQRRKKGHLLVGSLVEPLCHTKQAQQGWTRTLQKFAEQVGASEQK